MRYNPILLTDSYKVSHYNQYPPGTDGLFSFFESRGGRWTANVFALLQYWLGEYLTEPVTDDDIDEAIDILGRHFGRKVMNIGGWNRVVSVHGGRLPIRIRAVPEGTVVPAHNVLMTVESLDPALFWLTNYVETLLVQTWYPSTVATQSREMKKTILAALIASGTPEAIDFKLHDFGFRGSTSVESAAIGGAAHLINFKGTDSLPALMLLRNYYQEPCAGASIVAAEHSTITSWGRAREGDAYENILAKNPTGYVAVVSDSYDIFNACRSIWGGRLREQVLERDGVLVVRPDSGDPVSVVGEVLRLLGDAFGTERNEKGFKVLHPKVRVIQGDGIDAPMLADILTTTMAAGWSADNLAFGSGGGLIQKGLDRDTSRYAFKASSVSIDGTWTDVMKDPITDPTKRSKAGRLALIQTETGYQTVHADLVLPGDDVLQVVYEHGQLVDPQTFAQVRARAAL